METINSMFESSKNDNIRWQLSFRYRIRQESFGGLSFDRDKFHIFRLNDASYNALALLGRNAMSTSKLARELDMSFSEVDSFILSLSKIGVIRKENENKYIPPHLFYAPSPLDLTPDEAQILKPTEQSIGILRSPLFAWWDITSRCNFQCKYCYSQSGKIISDELNTLSVFRILDDLAKEGVFYIFFLGGEPYLRPDFLSILEHARKIGISSMLTTNGWFITEELAQKTRDAGVTIARVSVDGSTPSTHESIRGKVGSWQRAIDAIKFFKKVGIPTVGISPTVTSQNLTEIPDLLRMAEEIGVNEIQLTPVCATGRGANKPELSVEENLLLRKIVKDFKQRFISNGGPFLNAPEGIDDHKPSQCLIDNHGYEPILMGCGSGSTSIAIAANGNALSCILNRNVLGSMVDSTFYDIWHNSPTLLEYRRKRIECHGCKYQDNCSGLCPLIRAKANLNTV